MFLTLDITYYLIRLITLLLTYFWLIPVLGCFRAWVAKKMGDDTPEMLGYLTLDPFIHTDMVGLLVLCVFSAGWGAYIPVYLSNIQGRFANIKRACALFSDAFLSFVIGVITVLCRIVLVSCYPQVMIGTQSAPSAAVAMNNLLAATQHLSIFLMLVSTVINITTFIVWLVSKRTSFYNPYVQLFSFLGPLFIFILFGAYLERLFSGSIELMSRLILQLILG